MSLVKRVNKAYRLSSKLMGAQSTEKKSALGNELSQKEITLTINDLEDFKKQLEGCSHESGPRYVEIFKNSERIVGAGMGIYHTLFSVLHGAAHMPYAVAGAALCYLNTTQKQKDKRNLLNSVVFAGATVAATLLADNCREFEWGPYVTGAMAGVHTGMYAFEQRINSKSYHQKVAQKKTEQVKKLEELIGHLELLRRFNKNERKLLAKDKNYQQKIGQKKKKKAHETTRKKKRSKAKKSKKQESAGAELLASDERLFNDTDEQVSKILAGAGSQHSKKENANSESLISDEDAISVIIGYDASQSNESKTVTVSGIEKTIRNSSSEEKSVKRHFTFEEKLTILYAIEKEKADELLKKKGKKKIKARIDRLNDIFDEQTACELIYSNPDILTYGKRYFAKLKQIVAISAKQTPQISAMPGGRYDFSNMHALKLSQLLDQINSYEGLMNLERELSEDTPPEAYQALSAIERQIEDEGYDPKILYGLLAGGLELLGNSPRISQRYINKNDYWNNARKHYGCGDYKDAEAMFKLLVHQGFISTKKRGEVIRLSSKWHERDDELVVRYIGTLFEVRSALLSA